MCCWEVNPMNSERERAKTTEEKHEEAALELAIYQML